MATPNDRTSELARVKPEIPGAITELAGSIAGRGGRVFLVGGGIRDHLMGLPLKDWDLEVFGLTGEELAQVLRRHGSVNTVGKSFGVYKWRPRGGFHEEIDVSIPRRDSKVGPGHKGIAVEGDPFMDPVEAARRRDLTINAMMWDLVHHRLEDPWNGLGDLDAHQLRAVDRTTFLEDPLRALRVVQFAARLGFPPDAELVALCREAALDELPPERVQGEWGKLLLKGRDLILGFTVARTTTILDRVFPEVAAIEPDRVLDGLVAGPREAFEPEGRQWALMLAGWLAPATVDQATATLDRLGMFTWKGYPVRERVLSVLATLDAPLDTDTDLRRLATRTEVRLALTVRAVVEQRDLSVPLERAERLGVSEVAAPPLLLGRHLKTLGVAPGPAMGTLLKQVYELQLDGVVTTVDEACEAARTRLNADP